MEDIAPALWDKIQKLFAQRMGQDKTVQGLYTKVKDGQATYQEAHIFAERTGKICADVLAECLGGALPDDTLYFNIAQRTVGPALEQMQEIIGDVCAQIQNALNQRAGLGLKAVPVGADEERIDNLVSAAANAGSWEQAQPLLDEPVQNLAAHTVDESIERNAEMQSRAGLRAIVTRIAESGCCEWCDRIAGRYDYDKIKSTGEAFKRHVGCRCMIDFNPANTRELRKVTRSRLVWGK